MKRKVIMKENGKIVAEKEVAVRDYDAFLARKAHRMQVFRNKKKYNRKSYKKETY